MKLQIFTVRDRLTGVPGTLMVAENTPSLLRKIGDIQSEDHPWVKHPDDYDLYCVGDFNSDSMQIEPCNPTQICALSVVFGQKKEGK